MGRTQPNIIPIVPLAKGSVLLPGITLRVPVANRPDIPALLLSLFSRAKTPKPDPTAISIGVVPLTSSLLSSDGQNLIEDKSTTRQRRAEKFEVNPGNADKEDLFTYGTVAKISGVQGRRPGDLALIVEGLRRFRIDKITQEKPYFEAEVSYQTEDGMCMIILDTQVANQDVLKLSNPTILSFKTSSNI